MGCGLSAGIRCLIDLLCHPAVHGVREHANSGVFQTERYNMQLVKAEVAIHGKVDGCQEFTAHREVRDGKSVWMVRVEMTDLPNGQTEMTDDEMAATLACWVTGSTMTDQPIADKLHALAQPANDRLFEASLIP